MTQTRQVLITALVLAALTALTHAGLPAIGMALCSSDWGHAILESEKFRWGEFTAFYYGHDYGGTALSYLRALWVALTERFSGDATRPWLPHMIFSYTVEPILMAWASFYLASRYCSRFGAWIVGIAAAVGFQFWITIHGNDFYVAGYLFWCLFLAWQGGRKNPFLETSPLGLFLMAFVFGIAVYTNRASALYVGVFLFPLQFILRELRALAHPTTRLQKSLLAATAFFVGLYLYFSFFGRYLGVLPNGKRVYVDAEPNLRFAVILLFASHLLLRWEFYWQKLRDSAVRARLSALGAGLLLGFAPELIAKYTRTGPVGNTTNFHPSELREILQKLIDLPMNFKELIGGSHSIAQTFSVLLFLWAFIEFVRRSKSDRKTDPIWLATFVSILAFCSVSTYTSGVSRYLFPLFPPLLIMLGWFADRARTYPRYLQGFALILGLVFAVDHISASRHFVTQVSGNGELERREEVVRTFREAQVELVHSDSYLEANQYSVLGRENPPFEAEDGAIARRILEKASSQLGRVGFFLSGAADSPDAREYTWRNRRWKLEFLKNVGSRALYLGTPAQN